MLNGSNENTAMTDGMEYVLSLAYEDAFRLIRRYTEQVRMGTLSQYLLLLI